MNKWIMAVSGGILGSLSLAVSAAPAERQYVCADETGARTTLETRKSTVLVDGVPYNHLKSWPSSPVPGQKSVTYNEARYVTADYSDGINIIAYSDGDIVLFTGAEPFLSVSHCQLVKK